MTFTALFVGSFLACDLSVPPDNTSVDTGDTGNAGLAGGEPDNPDADTAPGGDTDTSSDTSGNTGTETGTPSDVCTEDNVTFTVGIRSEFGAERSTRVSRDDAVRVWGVIENPCDTSIEYRTPSRCIVESWAMKDSNHEEVASGTFPCAGPPQTHTVEPNSTLEQEVVLLHGLTVDEFLVAVKWSGGEEREASTPLVVVP